MACIYKINKNGITLSELLISIAIIAIIGLVLTNIIISAYSVVNTQQSYLNLQQETASALKKISVSTKESIAIVNYPEETPTLYPDSDTLILKLIGIDSDGSPISEVYDYFIYYLEDNNLKLLVDADPLSLGRKDNTTVISPFVDKLFFRYNTVDPVNSETVTITLIVSDEVGSQTKTVKAQTSAYIRN